MFFQFSPVRKPKELKIVKPESEPEKIEVLSLAPFAPVPKIFFDGIKVGQTATRKLLLINPTKQDISIFLTKQLPKELNVSYNWDSNVINKTSEVLFEIYWTPLAEESSYHKLSFESSKKTIHRDVPIIFKSVVPKNKNVLKKGKSNGGSSKPTQKSPTKKIYSNKPSNILYQKTSPSPNRTHTLKKKSPVKINIYYEMDENKENIDNETVFENTINIKSPNNYCSTPCPFTKTPPPLQKDMFEFSPEISNTDYLHREKKDAGGTTPSLESFLRERMERNVTKRFNLETHLDEINFNTSSTSTYNVERSFDTYVKDSLDLDSCIKGNLSGLTYTKDTSMESENFVSPVNNKVPPCMKVNIKENLTFTLDYYHNTQQLASIQEESLYYDKPMKRRKCDLDLTANHSRPGGGLTGPTDWTKKGGSSFRIAKSTSGLNIIKSGINGKKISQIAKTDCHSVIVQNPFLLAATNNIDPFLTPQFHINDEWMDQQENYFKKWLNSLLTPPEDLLSDTKSIDVAKVWQECKKLEDKTIHTKEEISNKYHVNAKLNSLRKSAQNLYRSKDITEVLNKVLQAIELGKLSIRQDKDVHLNLSLKADMMSLILNYNPLWLRIALETIYNVTIPLNSNSDVVGLGTFIVNRLFKDQYLIKKFKSIYNTKYVVEFNKFFLKKFFTLVYFLDKAKNNKLIPHDPCLFRVNGTVKESKEVLLILARELLSAVGDITKFLKYSGYVVTHVQTFIHEFDYAVKNLGVDLRDGIRLTKLMEIIMMKDDLTSNLRVPAISRLQKVHNMKIVFQSLENAEFKILNDILPKDIVDGHREKTLSFLWQIIYKFEAPLWVKKATLIQKWYRSLPVVLKRKKLQRIRFERENAALKIQKWYKRQIIYSQLMRFSLTLKQYLHILRREKAAVKIQSFYRMYRQKCIYMKQKETIIHIQRLARGWLVRNSYMNRIKSAIVIQSNIRMFLIRNRFIRLRNAATNIQKWYRSRILVRNAVKEYQIKKNAAILLQRRWRATLLAKKHKEDYQRLKTFVIKIQRRFRATQLSKIEQQNYQTIKLATIKIQNWYRSIKTMQKCRYNYIKLKQSVLVIEETYKALQLMRKQKAHYNRLKSLVISMQRRYRAKQLGKKEKINYINIKTAVVRIQSWYKCVIERKNFKALKKSVLIIEQRYEALKKMREERRNYLSLKSSAIIIQQRFRAMKCGKIQKQRYQLIKSSVLKIQDWYRSVKKMQKCRYEYKMLKQSVLVLEERYIALKLMQKEKEKYSQLKTSVINAQRRYRAGRLGKAQKQEFHKLKYATLKIQDWYRSTKKMRLCRQEYIDMKQSVLKIEQYYIAFKLMKNQKKDYLKLKSSAILVQQRYRAIKLCRVEKQKYIQLKSATIKIQKWYKATKLMHLQRNQYLDLKKNVLIIESRYIAKKIMQLEKSRYQKLRKACITIQQRYRSLILTRQCRNEYLKIKQATVVLQNRYRAKKVMESQRHYYLSLKQATIYIQRLYSAKFLMKIQREKFLLIKTSVIKIQSWYRATKIMKELSANYSRTKDAVKCIQIRWKAYKLKKMAREHYLKLRNATIIIQQRFRAIRAMKESRNQYLKMKNAACAIQNRYRAKKLMESQYKSYNLLKQTTIIIQRRYKAKLLMNKARKSYLHTREAIIKIQLWYRATIEMKKYYNEYKSLKNAAIIVQQKWRSQQIMRVEHQYYQSLKQATVYIQIRYRSILQMRLQRRIYLRILGAIVVIQRRYRAWRTAKQIRDEYLYKKQIIAKIQSLVRGFLVRKKYAYYFTEEAREERKIRKEQNAAALKIQAYWRGHRSRRLENEKLKQIRERFIKAQATALPENCVESRCIMALELINRDNSTLFHIIKALQDIEYGTRRSKNICIKFGQLLSNELYVLLSAMTRSLPEMNACILSLNILINFHKLEETRMYSFNSNHIDNLLNIMMHWCDKESHLFPTICTLLWLFAHTPQWKRCILNLPNIKQRFEKIKNLVIRKANMVKRQCVQKSSVFYYHKNLPLPSKVPDWGLDYPHMPFAFTNSQFALESLINILNLI